MWWPVSFHLQHSEIQLIVSAHRSRHTLPLGPCTRALTPSAYCKIQYSTHTHTHTHTHALLFFFATCNHGKDDRPEHGAEIPVAFLQKLVWRDLVPLLRMCQELQQPLDCASINGEKGWLESTVWGCVCLWTLILPAEADLTTMSGFLHCS